MNLILIETSGNQRYIFATNKLRENVGASELTYRVGTGFVLEAVKEVTGKTIYEDNDPDGSKLRANLLDKSKNPALEADQCSVEVITATSGKALLLVQNADVGRQIVRAVTERALREMPGLTVHGAISEDFDSLDDKNEQGEYKLHKAVGEVHHKLERIRYEMPSNEQRFLRVPFVAPCETSGLPASEAIFLSKDEREKNEAHRFSKVAWTKRTVLRKDRSEYEKEGEYQPSRIVGLIQSLFNIKLYEHLDQLEDDFKDLSWVAVIHADGNGLGKIFLNFDRHTGLQEGKCTPREYIEQYRRFSLALDVCTINAAGFALMGLQNSFMKDEAIGEIPVVPLILGGDDLTVLCDGQYALKFTHDFLSQFEKETSAISETLSIDGVTVELDYLKDVIGELQGVIPRIANNAFGNKDENNPSIKRLGICAGVAIVKPHFPFHQAYELAESLLKSAKQVKQRISVPASALDFHVLYDSAYSELDTIRERLRVDQEKSWLYAKPYVVTDEKNLSSAASKTWFENRKFSELKKRVEAMRAPDNNDPGKRALPNNQLHNLREALFLGSQEADARMKLIKQRYGTLSQLLCNNSLFFEEKDGEKKERATHFMDALDMVEFWKGF